MGRSRRSGLTAEPTAAVPPVELEMRLFAPGMTALHRAGLGGLACTLRYIEKAYQQGALSDDAVPGGPWADPESPPWAIEAGAVTLRFGEPENAREYLRRLYALGFELCDEMIHLPGQHRMPPTTGIRADLQLGLTLTFLQHGRTRTLAKKPTLASHDPEGHGLPAVTVEYKACSDYQHQKGWTKLTADEYGRDDEEKATKDSPNCLRSGELTYKGAVNPGAVVRHEAFNAANIATEPVKRLLPLHFALVGCIALPVNRGVGVLLVPEVEDVVVFAASRPFLTPTRPREGQVSGGSDAALQMQVRLKALNLGLTACHVITFRPTAWASQQKSRVHSVYVPKLSGPDLDVYELALAHLPPRIVVRTEKASAGKGRGKVTTEPQVAFRTDSVIRPLIADNLAAQRPWYAGFTRLMTATNPATDRPFRDAVRYEQRGLHAMVSDSRAWADQEGERLFVQAVHEAIRQRLRQIAVENEGNPKAMEGRMNRFREKLRIDLAGAKTEAHARFALADLFSRGGNNPVLRDAWAIVLPVLRGDWQLARDLGLLALASYASRNPASGKEDTPKPTTDTPEGEPAR